MCSDLKKENWLHQKAVKLSWYFPRSCSSIIFEKLLKNRITPHLEENMTQFQTGSVKGKGVVDNLFILKGTIDHLKYLGKELGLHSMILKNVLTVYGWKIVSIVCGDVESRMTFCT